MTITNQKGFTLVEGLLLIIAVSLIGFVGFYVYNANKNVTVTETTHTTQKQTKATEAPAKKDPVLYKGDGYTFYDMEALATTADQRGIAAAITARCSQDDTKNAGTTVAAVGAEDIFTNTSKSGNFYRDGNAVIVNAGCYDKSVGGDQQGYAANHYVRKTDGKWNVLFASQVAPTCEDLDGKGFANIAPRCYEEGTTQERATRN